MRNILLDAVAVSCRAAAARPGRPAAGSARPALHNGVLLQGAMGASAGIPATLPEEPLPVAPEEAESGRMISVKIEQPANHMTEDARWDYRVTIRFKNSTVATTANPDEERLIKQLWPDQETYKREEQRRFEILLAHWDLPVTDITPAKK